MLPVGDDLEDQRWRPRATYLLLLLLAVGFVYTHVVLAPSQREALFRAFGLVPARLLADPGSGWPLLLTHLFLHGSLLHFLGNALFLWVFARGLEAELRWFFLPTFLGLGALAGLVSALLRPDSDISGIGASGAISAILGAYLVLFPEANVRLVVLVPWSLLALLWRGTLPVLDVPAWVFLPIWLGLQVFGGLGNLLSPSGVDYAAHLAGFLAGYGLIRGLREVFHLWPEQPARRLGWEPLLQAAHRHTGAYLAACRPLQAGRVLEPDDVMVVDQFRGGVDPDAVPARNRRSVLGHRLRVERFRYEPLLWSDLEPPGPREEGKSDSDRRQGQRLP